MSNAGAAFSLTELLDAAPLPIEWTSRRPRIKIGPPATGAGPASCQSLRSGSVRRSTGNEEEGNLRGEIARRRRGGEGWEEEEESSNGDGSREIRRHELGRRKGGDPEDAGKGMRPR
jgi:hypothetical protein